MKIKVEFDREAFTDLLTSVELSADTLQEKVADYIKNTKLQSFEISEDHPDSMIEEIETVVMCRYDFSKTPELLDQAIRRAQRLASAKGHRVAFIHQKERLELNP